MNYMYSKIPRLRPSLITVLSVVSLWSSQLTSRAQNLTDIPPPTPPFVAEVPASAEWTITVKAAPTPRQPAGSSGEVARIVEVHTSKSAELRCDVISYSDGRKLTHYFVNTLLLWKSADGEVFVSDLKDVKAQGTDAPAIGADDPNPSIPNGFPGVGWLQLASFDKVVAFGGRACYHYIHGDAEAWINVENRRPVAYKKAGSEYQYQFADKPGTAPVLPDEFKAALAQMQKMTRRRQLLERPPLTSR